MNDFLAGSWTELGKNASGAAADEAICSFDAHLSADPHALLLAVLTAQTIQPPKLTPKGA